MRRILCLILIVNICFFSTNVFAESDSFSFDVNKQVTNAKTAYVQNVNKYGTNLNNDIIDKSGNTIKDTKMTVTLSQNNTVIVKCNVLDKDIKLEGIPSGRSENGNIIYFTAKPTNDMFSILNFSYERDISKSNMYFKDYYKTKASKSTNILKIYFKVNNTQTKDYVLLESFDCNLNFDDNFINSLQADSLLGAWAATQFEPIRTEEHENITTRAITDYTYYTYTAYFQDLGISQTHTITFMMHYDVLNIPIGGEATQIYTLRITGKTMSVPSAPNLNSSTMSYLMLNNVKLRQVSIPNAAFRGTDIDGTVNMAPGLPGEFKASIGIKLGLLNLSYSIPISFTPQGDVDLNSVYTGYLNGVNGQYTRMVETKMNNGASLTQIGHEFVVKSILRDYGNVARSSSTFKSEWNVEYKNSGTLSTWLGSYPHNSNISIN